MDNLDLEQRIDQEVRLRVLEEITQDLYGRLNRIEDKMDNQFKMIVGAVVTMIGGLILAKVI